MVGGAVGMVAEVVGGLTGGEQGADGWNEGGDPQPEAALEAAAELVGRDGGGGATVRISGKPTVGVILQSL